MENQDSDSTGNDNGVNRRGFLLRAAGVGAGVAAAAATGDLTFTRVFAAGPPYNETTQDILNAALTAEQLATTFYYQGIVSSHLPNVHSTANLNYFKAALWQEYQHASLFASLGAQSLAGSNPKFYFPTGAFDSDGAFLGVLDALETAFIGAYIAAIGEWAGDAPSAVNSTGSFTGPQLAKIAAQIMGTEAEHRALGRVTGNENPPNNLIFERAPFTNVGNPAHPNGTAVGALLPFVTGGSGFSGPIVLPDAEDVKEKAAPYTNLIRPPLAGA